MMNKTIAFHTLGCKLNYAETSTYERGFVQAGLQVVPWEEPADVYLVNTCSVTQRSEQKCRNLIRKMHRTAPEARIIVTGCYAQLRPADLEALEGVARVFGAQEKNRVVPETLALLREETPPPAPPESVLPAYSTGERTRSFLKVQDGCDNFCAYCTVPFARGRSRNLAIADLVPQAQAIAAQGVKEIVLTGVNTGDFGRTTGESFLDLLKALDGVDGIERYRISSIEPNLISDGIIDWIASGTKFQPHFHIPLQTGTDTLLKRVGRRYTTDFFAGRIDRIRERIGGHVFFGIDVIAGLPGETDEDFRQTYRFLEERIQPAYLHVFPYSRVPGPTRSGTGSRRNGRPPWKPSASGCTKRSGSRTAEGRKPSCGNPTGRPGGWAAIREITCASSVRGTRTGSARWKKSSCKWKRAD